MHRIFTVVALIVFACVGCQGATEKKNEKKPIAKADPKSKHDSWWCEEHGAPEHLCSLCSAEVAEKYKKEGKWCKIHDRAEEQCYLCDPERYKKYEAMYEAKYGKKPPRPPESEFKK